ncbi:RCC1-like domain-containing protein [Secundilactobacillus pentosiphilus]|uniref:RCC1-like domain-containing protein n=1 Tax=Secundilactobacillus pentosiphilus TaxID=1714682 RepID=UPI001CDA60AD|nr:RCC1 domain-containing protein [Secundilactobacillus pentosiphilus]
MPHFKFLHTIAAGRRHTIAIKTDGTAMAAGDNQFGQCDVSQFHRFQLPNAL